MRTTRIVVCVIFLCFMDNVWCTFGEFLGNLPTEIGSAFSSAWEAIKDAIKTPVRIKRLGPGGKKKKTLPPTTPIFTTEVQVTEEEVVTPSVTTGDRNKLKLPLLPTPRWRSFWDGKEVQKLHYVQRRKAGNTKLEPTGYFRSRMLSVMTFDQWRKMQSNFYKTSEGDKRSRVYNSHSLPSSKR